MSHETLLRFQTIDMAQRSVHLDLNTENNEPRSSYDPNVLGLMLIVAMGLSPAGYLAYGDSLPMASNCSTGAHSENVYFGGDGQYQVMCKDSGGNTLSSDCCGCFGSWAALSDTQLVYLRGFRDDYLVGNPVGEKLTESYYDRSPKLIAASSNSPGFKRFAHAVLAPVAELAGHLPKHSGQTTAFQGYQSKGAKAKVASGPMR